MLKNWLALPDGKTNTMIRDTGTLALNVISTIAFENHDAHTEAPGHTLSLRDALSTVMSTNISLLLENMLPWLKDSWLSGLLPRSVGKLLTATREFNEYMDELVARERAKPSAPS
jgi:hypothetical protein